MEANEVFAIPDPEPAPEQTEAIILGCGVSGLAAAYELSRQGLRVTVLENYSHAGGNHLSRQIDRMTFDIGAIFFWSTSPMIKMFPTATATWVPIEISTGRVTPLGAVHTYPIDVKAEILALPFDTKMRIAADVLYHKLFHRRRESVRDFALQHLGRRMFEDTGLEVFFERFCGRPAEEIVYSFAEWRMRWIARKASLRGILSAGVAKLMARLFPAGAPDQCYARPQAGFGEMYAPIVNQLEEAGVRFIFDAGLTHVARTDDGFEVAGQAGVWHGTRVLNTMPLAVTGALAGRPELAPPESSRLVTLFCRFRGTRNFPHTVFYNFNPAGAWKRLTMHSDYYGQVDGAEYFSAECTITGGTSSPDALFADFRSTTRGFGLFDGELELVGHMETDFAYPVLDAQSVADKDHLLAELGAMGIEGFGRQGAFEYIASSNLAIELAQAATQSGIDAGHRDTGAAKPG